MKKIKGILAILIAWFVVHELVIIVDGILSEPEKSEYALIFGNTVHEDGRMSDRLQARMDRGLALYRDGVVDRICVSGGLGTEGHYEAQVMAAYLQQMGVPQTSILIDDNGKNTWLTAINFKGLVPNCTSVVVVTQHYHISRAKLALRKVGVPQVSGASPSYFEWRDAYALFREFFAYYRYLAHA